MARIIAIVEDEARIRENYADALRRRGYSVNSYSTRRAAMEAFSAVKAELGV